MFKFFENLLEPFPEEIPQQAPDTLWAFCRHYSKGAEKFIVIMAISSGLIAIFEAALFGFLGRLVDWLSTQSRETFLADEGKTLLLYGFFILVLMPIVVSLHAMITHQTLLGNYPMVIRWQSHRYLLAQGLAFYQDELAGRVATKVMQTALAVREAVMKLLDLLLYVVVYILSIVIVIGKADPRLTIPIGIWLVFYVILLRYFLPKLKEVATRQADARSTMTGRIVDSYTNIMTVKLFSHASRESDYAKEGMEGFLNTVYPQMRLGTQLTIYLWGLNTALTTSITALSIYLWMQDSVSTGAIAVALALALRLNGMSHWIMWETGALFENIGTVQDGLKTLSQPHTIVDAPDAQAIEVNDGTLEFNAVHFAYKEGLPVFENLDMQIKAGEKVGLVGRSGSGKSTFVNLLLRIYDIQQGLIKIDGQDIKLVTQESLRGTIGIVTQDTSLLHRSVRDNILFGRPTASEEELIEAAKKAEAHEFILGLEDSHGRTGYDAQVGERGVKLSGGQRQRIAIARVLLKDAPILILDEATSALDSEVEKAIQESLDKLIEGKTVIAIAHRLSTLAAMDRLVVLDEGKIVEEGTHGGLVADDGLYAQLWAHQSGGFIGES